MTGLYHKTVFISYSQDSTNHMDWVKKLADYLQTRGIRVILDQYHLNAGKNMTLFMETSIESADKVLIILTPEYKAKSDGRNAGVGYEYSMISSELFDIQNNNTKFIPVLRSGGKQSSLPIFLKQFIYVDMRDDTLFDVNAFKLLREILDSPEIVQPPLGEIPDLQSSAVDPILAMATSIQTKIELEKRKKSYLESHEALNTERQNLTNTFRIIHDKAEDYKNKTKLFFKADYKSGYEGVYCLTLISNGLSAGILLSIPAYSFLNQAKLMVKVWNKPVSVMRESLYPPGELQELKSYEFTASVDDDLNIIWICDEISIKTADLQSFVFQKLLEEVAQQ